MAAFSTIALGLSAVAATAGAVSAYSQAQTAKKSASAQASQLAEAKSEQDKADALVAEQTARSEKEAQSRAARLSTGRKGLLYQSDETGVDSTTLG